MNAGKPPSRDWRAQPPAHSAYAREWRGAHRPAVSRFSRQFKLRAVTITLIVLVGAIVYLLAPAAQPVLPVQVVTFGIGAYGGRANPQGNMPVNPFGESDARAFGTLHDRHPDQFPPVRNEDNALNGAQFLSFLRTEADSAALDGRHLLVFCSLHGLVQPTGDVELFAIDATPDSPTDGSGAMIPLRELVDVLQNSRARRVVLVLDAARLAANWRLGILANDVAAEVLAKWPAGRAASPPTAEPAASNVTILLAAGPGQQSGLADGQSALVRSLIEGLDGAADGWRDDGRPVDSQQYDRRISLHELTAFVRGDVADWNRTHTAQPQTVELVGNTSDFEFVVVSPPVPIPKPAEGKAEGASKGDADAASATSAGSAPDKAAKSPDVAWNVRLVELWKARDAWRDSSPRGRDPVCRQLPVTWRRLESRLALAESLARGGLSDLAPQAVQQADAAAKSLQGQSAAPAALLASSTDTQRDALIELGFGGNSGPLSKDVAAATTQYLQSLLKDGAPAPAGDVVVPAADAIQAWLIQELLRDASPAGWDPIRLIVKRLTEVGRLPSTPEMVLLQDLLRVPGREAGFGAGPSLRRMLDLHQRYRRLAVTTPESLPLVRETVNSGLRALLAAERWLLASNGERPEVRAWLDKADQALASAEQAAVRYQESVGVWSDLLAELPGAAEWIASRANDDDHRKVDWLLLRELARQWSDRERDHQWNPELLLASWPDRPARLADLERRLLTLFVDAQQLKVALLAGPDGSEALSAENLSNLANRAMTHRREFWEEVRRSLPRLGTAEHPTPAAWREADRLLGQSWLTAQDRERLDALRTLAPQGDPLVSGSVDTGAVWQSFWAIAALSLLSPEADVTADLWKDWERLEDQSTTSLSGGDADQALLRRRRAELGKSIRSRWSVLQSRAQSASTIASLSQWQLLAATLDPTILPPVDPDVRIRNERTRQFAEWLVVYAGSWRQRSFGTAGDGADYAALAQRAESLAQELAGAGARPGHPVPGRIQSIDRPAFDSQRMGSVSMVVIPGGGESATLQVLLTGEHVRLVEGNRSSTIRQPAALPLSADGRLSAQLRLDDEVETPQPLLAVLAEPDGFPLDFREVLLHPPFDPTLWRIEIVEAASGTRLETVPTARPAGAKIFLPPQAEIGLRANLIRPTRDATASARIDIFRLTESSRVPLVEGLELALEAGQERTPVPGDLPAPPADKEKSPPKPAVVMEPLADLAHGWVYVITPEGQAPFEFVIRPTFWSAAKFLADPRPTVVDDRFQLPLERLAPSTTDVLLPAKVPVELSLPDSLRNSLTDYTLGGPVGVGQRLTLSFGLPKGWRDQTRDRPWALSLDVAGLPHAYRWQLLPSGDVTLLPGLPPHVAAHLVLPPPDPKGPPRLEPVIQKGKEPLRVRFTVDATELDRSEGTGDWTLSYTVTRETETGSEPTPLQQSWRLFSSVERHVLLDAIQGGEWKLRTSAVDYEMVQSEADIRGLMGRFQVQGALTRADQPQTPVARTGLRFAIDDDAPPDLEAKGIGVEARLIDRDFAFAIEAADAESGIHRIAYGFDANDDKALQPDEEQLEELTLSSLDNPKKLWSVVIPKARLGKLQKDEETRRLIVVAENGLGTRAIKSIPVTFRKPMPPPGQTHGKLTVALKISRGGRSTIQLTGPEARLQEITGDSFTFTNLPPGQYQISVKVNYAVIGRKEAGEAKVDVKAGETTTASIPLSVAK
ncbi:hypothetical protein [Planctellipticum variicoloris]|uniref:hypothetical protein n=1 Tax=Planctellipticum variicoloris TaxID=3064265 RepID=UPI003013993B|nr:hypothetical protein SH412_003065 [Planctomycetaceae bacterium SH412]